MEQKRKCKGRRTNGEPCNNWPVRGALVCRKHGGGAPQVRAAASRALAEQEVRRGLARLDVAAVDDPLTELSKLAGQVVAWKDALADKVNELTTLRYEAMGAGTEQLRAEVALFERALDRCAAVLGLIAKLGIDDRMARISELQAAAVVRALDAGLRHAGVTGTVAAESRAVAARELRSVG
jgi:hypothetical protein